MSTLTPISRVHQNIPEWAGTCPSCCHARLLNTDAQTQTWFIQFPLKIQTKTRFQNKNFAVVLSFKEKIQLLIWFFHQLMRVIEHALCPVNDGTAGLKRNPGFKFWPCDYWLYYCFMNLVDLCSK